MVTLNFSALLGHRGHQPQAGLSLHSGDRGSHGDCFGGSRVQTTPLRQTPFRSFVVEVAFLIQSHRENSHPGCALITTPRLPGQSLSGCRDALPEHSLQRPRPIAQLSVRLVTPYRPPHARQSFPTPPCSPPRQQSPCPPDPQERGQQSETAPLPQLLPAAHTFLAALFFSPILPTSAHR